MAELVIPGETLSETKLAKLLDLVRENPEMGTVAAAIQVGIPGTKGEIRTLLEPVEDEIRQARVGKTKKTLYEISHDKGHPGVVRAADLILRHEGGPEWRDKQQIELSAPDGLPPLEIEGGRVTSLADVLDFARELGVGLGEGLRAGATRDALPPAPHVLPDPSDSQ